MNSDFLAFLTDDQGRSLTENENGVIVTSSIPNPLESSPEGWQKNSIQWTRNTEFRGVIKAYTTPIKFHYEGARILRKYFYSLGMEVVLFFIWLKLDTTFTGNMLYKSWFKGRPDWYSIEDDDDGVQISLIEAGLSNQITLDASTVYEVDFDDDAVSLILDGMDIMQSTNYLITNGLLPTDNGQHCIDAQLLSIEAVNEIDSTSQVRTRFKTNADLAKLAPLTVTNPGNPVVMNMSWHMGFSCSLADGISPNPTAAGLLLIRCLDADTNAALGGFPLTAYGAGGTLYQHHFLEGSVSLTIPANAKVYLCQFLTLGGVIATGSSADGVVFWNYDNGENDFFKSNYTYKFKETVIDCQTVFNLGNKLIQNISKSASILNSDLLSQDVNLLVSSGDAIRGIQDSVIKTSFTDYHKSVDAVKCVSFSIENNNGKLETRAYAFKNTENGNLGTSSNFKLTTANEYIYDTIVNGYPPQDIDDVNGKYSFCNTVTYKTPATFKNTYDIKSVYLADPFVIEIMRINLDGKTTTDGNTDNSVFFLDAEKVSIDYPGQYTMNIDGTITLTGLFDLLPGMRLKLANISKSYKILGVSKTNTSTIIKISDVLIPQTKTGIQFFVYRLRRKAYTSITGIPNASTVFNLELSPKTILMNHYNWIRGACYKLDSGKIVFQTTDKNDKLVRDGIIEREDIPISKLGDKSYIPYYMEFNAESEVNLLDSVDLGYYLIDGYKGFPISLKTEPATLETQSYKLLATPLNDFSGLINR